MSNAQKLYREAVRLIVHYSQRKNEKIIWGQLSKNKPFKISILHIKNMHENEVYVYGPGSISNQILFTTREIFRSDRKPNVNHFNTFKYILSKPYNIYKIKSCSLKNY
jgi:hypothetical protein